MMSKQETSLCKFLAVVATAGALAAGLGACQKKEETTMPPTPSEQPAQKTPMPPDKNPSGDTSNIKPPTDQGGGDTGQKSQ